MLAHVTRGFYLLRCFEVLRYLLNSPAGSLMNNCIFTSPWNDYSKSLGTQSCLLKALSGIDSFVDKC